MDPSIRGARSAGFLFTIVCFLMPFVTLSCPVARFSFTGSQLALGTTIAEPQVFGPPKTQVVPAEPSAVAAAASAAVGAVAGLVNGGAARAIAAVAALAGGGSLLALKNRIDTEARTQALGLVTVTFEIGYWAALLGYVLAFVLNLALRSARAGSIGRAGSTGSAPEVASSSGSTPVDPPPDTLVTGLVPTQSFLPPSAAASGLPAKHYCGNCGAKLGSGISFCPSCGMKV